MAYAEDLAGRIRDLVADEPDLTEQAMFGGLAFLVGGNMAVAASGRGGLMVRADPAEADALIASGRALPLEMRGRPVRGWVRVGEERLGSRHELAAWVDRGVAFARSLPAKR